MRHPSKVGSFCERAGDKKLGGGHGPLACGKHLKKGPKPRERYRRSVEIPGRRESMNLAMSMLLGLFASRKKSSVNEEPKR